jgi:hypothetical protein
VQNEAMYFRFLVFYVLIRNTRIFAVSSEFKLCRFELFACYDIPLIRSVSLAKAYGGPSEVLVGAQFAVFRAPKV